MFLYLEIESLLNNKIPLSVEKSSKKEEKG